MNLSNIQNAKVIVFDVDGVIVDSTEECLVVAYNAYLEYNGCHDKKKLLTPEDANDSYRKHFRSIRNYVRSMDEYLAVFLVNEGAITSQTEYEKALEQLDASDLKRYGEYFFNEREKLKATAKNQWIALHRIYEGIGSILEYVTKKYIFFIVTGKDKASVIDILESLGIAIEPDKIFDRYVAKNKLESLQRIAKSQNVSNKEVFFIDDNIVHLIPPKLDGFQVLMADWGYGLKEHFELACYKKIKIISRKDLKGMLEID